MVTLRLNRGSTNKTVAEKSDCGLFHFVFCFFLFSQFNQVAQLHRSYKSRLKLKRGGWVLAQIGTVKFAFFSVHGLKNISSHIHTGTAKKFTEKRKAKYLTFYRRFWG